jgi:hypothetical protein
MMCETRYIVDAIDCRSLLRVEIDERVLMCQAKDPWSSRFSNAVATRAAGGDVTQAKELSMFLGVGRGASQHTTVKPQQTQE